MQIYLLVTAVILAVSAAVTFQSKRVTNKHLLLHLILFPVVYVISDMPLDNILSHFGLAAIMFIIGFVLVATRSIGGGVGKTLVIVGLWVPGFSMFFGYITFALIAAGICAFLLMAFSKSKNFTDFAAVLFACCCGFLLYQQNDNLKMATYIQSAEQKAETTPALPPTLRRNR